MTLFGAPKPRAYPLPAMPEPTDAAAEARRAADERRRRARYGTVATSLRGVLLAADGPRRKSLLGE